MERPVATMTVACRLALVAALVCACAAPGVALADEPIDDPVRVPVEGSATEGQVGRAVRAALTRRGWTAGHEKPGYVEGTLSKGEEYVVKIGLSYDARSVTIRYLHSDGLDYDKQERTIHRGYNKWMRMLAKEIGINLALFAGADPREHANPDEPVLLPQVVPVMPQDAAAAPAAPAIPAPATPAPAPAPSVPPVAATAGTHRLRAGAELHAQAKLASPVMVKNPAEGVVSPKGPVKNGEGTWWYVSAGGKAGWVLQSDLR